MAGPDFAAKAALNAMWVVEVADMLLSSGIYFGHAWPVPRPITLIAKDTQLDALWQGNHDHAAYQMALVNLLLEVREKALPS